MLLPAPGGGRHPAQPSLLLLLLPLLVVGLHPASAAASWSPRTAAPPTILRTTGGGGEPAPPLALLPVTHSYMFRCNATFPYIHNAMLEVLPGGALAGAFQAGAAEGSADQVALFTRSRDGGATWDPPALITPLGAAGAQWAPILRFDPPSGLLHVHYVAAQQLMQVTSTNLGDTWSAPVPMGIGSNDTRSDIVFTCNKLAGAAGTGGARRLLLPFDSVKPNRAFVATSDDAGVTWQMRGNITLQSSTFLEPAVAATGAADGAGLLMSLRASDGNLYLSRSSDAGTTWTAPTAALAAADTKTAIWAFAGLTSGLLLSYNVGPNRAELLLSVSYDGGATFATVAVLESGTDNVSHCYPTTIANGTHTLTAYSEYEQAKSPNRIGVKVAVTPLPL